MDHVPYLPAGTAHRPQQSDFTSSLDDADGHVLIMAIRPGSAIIRHQWAKSMTIAPLRLIFLRFTESGKLEH
jgi:hypothetical protein